MDALSISYRSFKIQCIINQFHTANIFLSFFGFFSKLCQSRVTIIELYNYIIIIDIDVNRRLKTTRFPMTEAT